MSRDLELNIRVRDDGTVVVNRFAQGTKSAMAGLSRETATLGKNLDSSWNGFFRRSTSQMSSYFSSFSSGIQSVYRDFNSLFQFIKRGALYTTGILGGLGAAVYALDKKVLTASESFRRFETSMKGSLGSAVRARELTEYSLERALVTPAQTGDIQSAIQALAMIPATRVKLLASDFGDVRKELDMLTDTLIGLSAIKPEQGIPGALMAMREALGGNWRSLMMRFEISPAVVAESIGKSLSEIQGRPEETIRAVHAFVMEVMGEGTLRALSRMPSVLAANIKDAFLLAFKKIGDFGLYDWLVDQIASVEGRLRRLVEEDLGGAIGQGLAASLVMFTQNFQRLFTAGGAEMTRWFFPDVMKRTDLDSYQKALLAMTQGFEAAAGAFEVFSRAIRENGPKVLAVMKPIAEAGMGAALGLGGWINRQAGKVSTGVIEDTARGTMRDILVGISRFVDLVADIPNYLRQLIEQIRYFVERFDIRFSQFFQMFSFGGMSGNEILRSYLSPTETSALAARAGDLGIQRAGPSGFGFGGYSSGDSDLDLALKVLRDPNFSTLKNVGVDPQKISMIRERLGLRNYDAELLLADMAHMGRMQNIPATGQSSALGSWMRGLGESIGSGNLIQQWINEWRSFTTEVKAQMGAATTAVNQDWESRKPFEELSGIAKSTLGLAGRPSLMDEHDISQSLREATITPMEALTNTYEEIWKSLSEKTAALDELAAKFEEWKATHAGGAISPEIAQQIEGTAKAFASTREALSRYGLELEQWRTTQMFELLGGPQGKAVMQALRGRDLSFLGANIAGPVTAMRDQMMGAGFSRDIRAQENIFLDPRYTFESRKEALNEWFEHHKSVYQDILSYEGWSAEQRTRINEIFYDDLKDLEEQHRQHLQQILDEQKELWTSYCQDVIGIYRGSLSEGLFRAMRGEFESLGDVMDSFFASMQKRLAELAVDWVFQGMGIGKTTPGGGGGGFMSILQSIPLIGNLFGNGKAEGGLVGGPFGPAIAGERVGSVEAVIPLKGGAVPVRMVGGQSVAPIYVINTVDPSGLVAAGLPANARIVTNQIGSDLRHGGPLSLAMGVAR